MKNIYLHTKQYVHNSPPKNHKLPNLMSITECMENIQEQG
jgi:hypothetical protein